MRMTRKQAARLDDRLEYQEILLIMRLDLEQKRTFMRVASGSPGATSY
jgi:hypothetical protein